MYEKKFWICIYCWICVLVCQSCLTLCNPMDCSLPGSSVHGISQAKILEWIDFSFSRGPSQHRYRTCVSCTAGRFFTTKPPRKQYTYGWFMLSFDKKQKKNSVKQLSFNWKKKKKSWWDLSTEDGRLWLCDLSALKDKELQHIWAEKDLKPSGLVCLNLLGDSKTF